jgi:hypothetical protein
MNYHEVNALPFPHKCGVCGTSARGCLDLGISFLEDWMPFDRMGAVLICTVCFAEGAQEMGYTAPDKMDIKLAEAKEQAYNESFERARHNVLDLARSIIDLCGDDPDLSVAPNSADVLQEQDGEVNSVEPGGGDREVDSPFGGAGEPDLFTLNDAESADSIPESSDESSDVSEPGSNGSDKAAEPAFTFQF